MRWCYQQQVLARVTVLHRTSTSTCRQKQPWRAYSQGLCITTLQPQRACRTGLRPQEACTYHTACCSRSPAPSSWYAGNGLLQSTPFFSRCICCLVVMHLQTALVSRLKLVQPIRPGSVLLVRDLPAGGQNIKSSPDSVAYRPTLNRRTRGVITPEQCMTQRARQATRLHQLAIHQQQLPRVACQRPRHTTTSLCTTNRQSAWFTAPVRPPMPQMSLAAPQKLSLPHGSQKPCMRPAVPTAPPQRSHMPSLH